MQLRRFVRAPLAAASALLVTVSASPVSAAPIVAAAGEATFAAAGYGSAITFVGHGFGHGRGLGQWGSLGYAVDRGSTFDQILATYYPNTSPGSIDTATTLSVRLTELDDLGATVLHDGGGLVTSAAPGLFSALRVVKRTGVDVLDVYSGSGCDGGANGWQLIASVATTDGTRPAVTFDVPGRADGDPVANLMSICEPDGQRRYYRGTMSTTLDANSAQRTINAVSMEQYLRGVVPRESPASWGDSGGGKGMNALRAQAVAARSYAASEARYTYARTCDSQSCQVYAGAAVVQPGTSAVVLLEDKRSDLAVTDTAGQVRMLSGVVARTEFSASTGGWTAGGTFPVVQDLGDATSANPNVNWSTTVNRVDLEAKYPTIGSLLLIDVTKRNGVGDFGGRVQTVVLRGTTGSVSLTGDDLRRALNLKSDWYYVRPPFSDNPVTGVANTASGSGYWFATNDGGVYNFGVAPYSGSMSGTRLNSPVIGVAAAGSTGYWLLGRDGGVFSFGSAAFYGSTGGIQLNKPVVAMAGRPQGDGYWFVASDGGIFAYGGAQFFGSMGGSFLSRPIVGMAPTASGNGYWAVASDGGIFAFGDAQFYGSTGGLTLVKPVVGMAARPQGDGYWLVASDGGVFSFGAAGFAGSAAGKTTSPVVSIASTPTGNGYRIVATDGTVFGFGDAAP